MRPLLSRYRYRSGFVLRRLDKAAGEINAFLIAATLGLGMLDLAYTGREDRRRAAAPLIGRCFPMPRSPALQKRYA